MKDHGRVRAQGMEMKRGKPLELEAQHEELRRAQLELEAARNRYENLYELAPVGYLTLDATGVILEANLRSCTLFGLPRKALIRKNLGRFVAREDQDRLHRHLREIPTTGTKQTCELHLLSTQGLSPVVLLESVAVQDKERRSIRIQTVLIDITQRVRMGEALRERDLQLEGLIGAAMDAIISVDEDQRIMLFNAAAEKMFQCPAGEAVGKTIDRFIPVRFRQSHQQHFHAFAHNNETARRIGRLGTVFGLRSNGEEFPIEASVSQIAVQGKRVFTVILRDITERMRTEEALRRSEERFRRMFDESPVGAAIVAPSYRFWRVNKELCRITGYSAAELTQLGFPDITHPDDLEADLAQARRLVAGEIDQYEMDKRYVRKDGGVVWIKLYVRLMRDVRGQPLYFLPMMKDITERKRDEEALRESEKSLRQSREQLRALAGKLLTTLEEERRRMARDLHDDFDQRLAALAVEVETVERCLPLSQEEIREHLGSIQKQVAQLSDDIHHLAYQLHPSILEDLGLEVALRSHLDDFANREGIRMVFAARRLSENLPREIASCLYRVAQESLRNIAKHARASTVTVKLAASDRAIGLSVKDDGVGFDPLALKLSPQRGLGLLSMEERVRLLNGSLSVRSHPGRGTHVVVRIPLPARPA